MHSRKQSLDELWKDYQQAGQLQRGGWLDAAQKRTGRNSKYLIRVLNRRPRPRA